MINTKLITTICVLLVLTSISVLAQWKIDVISVYDGDTITANVHLPFNITLSSQKIRLLYIDAPEIKGGDEDSKEAAIKSRDHLIQLLDGNQIYLYTDPKRPERDSFGRILGILKTKKIIINKQMIKDGHAVLYIR